jgi:hypothetical protein
MSNADNGKFVNTQLDGTHLADFERIEGYYGINTNSDVVHFLIRQEARRLTTAATLADPAIGDVVAAYLARHITAEEAVCRALTVNLAFCMLQCASSLETA